MSMTQNVLILTSNTGGGHRSAANALQDSFTGLDPERIFVRITQVLEEASLLTRNFANIYNYLLRHHQEWVQYYYWFIEKLKPNESHFVLNDTIKYGARLFEKYTPDVIVSVHPMTQHFIAYLLKRIGLADKIPIVTVVTDPCYGFWRGWACDIVKKYYVASSDARQQLLDYDVPSELIQVAGMPVHHKFSPVNADERKRLRAELGLDPDAFTLFINAGWVGGGNIPHIFEHIASSDLKVQAIYLTGHNTALRDSAKRMAETSPIPIHVMGFRRDVQHLMNASDVMISKLGGLTTFEAMACELPIIADTITTPMPQEAQTASLIHKEGSGLLLERADAIVPMIKGLLDSPESCGLMREAASRCSQLGASERIARDILGFINADDPRAKLQAGTPT